MSTVNLNSPRYVKKALFWGLVGLAILIILPIQQSLQKKNLERSPIAHIESISERLVHALASTTLEAQAYIIYDVVDDKILFGKNIEQQLPLASLTKVMTAIVATESMPNFSMITVPDDIPKVDARIIQPGQKWSLRELLDYTLVVSSNEGAQSVASVVGAFEKKENESVIRDSRSRFIDKMNQKADELGMFQTYFINEDGLDVSEPGFVSGAYGSIKDLATLFTFTLKEHSNIFEATTYDVLLVHSQNKSYTAENTNKVINQLPGLIGSKTGLTDLSGGNLVVALDVGISHPMIIGVLGSSERGRFNDVVLLSQAVVESLSSYR